MRRISALLALMAFIVSCPPLCADTYIVTLEPGARAEPATGRVVLFFIIRTGRPWDHRDPIEGPFFEAPQPIASIEVKDFKPGESVKLDGTAIAFPDSLDKLNGQVRVQAILDADQTERSHEQGPGNVYSDVVGVELSDQKDDAVSLKLNHRIDAPQPRGERANLRWISLRSELLSNFYGRDVHHRAGVALPRGHSDPNHPRQQWPAIYVIPGYGGREEAAENYAAMLGDSRIEEIAPIAVYIVLDPEAPLGHHGFANSANNGPRETALITELIPYLNAQFRLVDQPEARLITGHSSGGWASLWLQLNHPEVFGGCWASSPDPVDFSAFQMTDLYSDLNLYVDAEGKPTPSYRGYVESSGEMAVHMTVQQECGMENAIDPTGRSGQQWDAWEAMFSPRDPATGLPKPMFDPKTGAIDKSVMRQWSKFDITNQMMKKWERYSPVILEKVRLACGDDDSYYLNRAVERFGEQFEQLQGEQKSQGSGYVLMVEDADHDVLQKIFQRWNKEMREHLQRHGLQDADAAPSP